MFGKEEENAVSEIVRTGKWAGNSIIQSAESHFSNIAGTKHAIATGTGLGALRLALRALGIGPNDAVAVPGYCCVALANAVLAVGAKPVPVGIERETLNICPKSLKKALKSTKPKIRAAIVVHMFGLPANIESLNNAGIPLIEDCSHAFGRNGLGSQGGISIMSLYATKLVGAGEGGMVFTQDDEIMKKVRYLLDYTDKKPGRNMLNDKPNCFSAAIAICQLAKLPEFLTRRDYLAERYNTALRGVAEKGLCRLPKNIPKRIWYRYTLEIASNIERVIFQMKIQGVTVEKPVKPWCDSPGNLCREAFARTISLPIYPALTDELQDKVISAFLKTIEAKK